MVVHDRLSQGHLTLKLRVVWRDTHCAVRRLGQEMVAKRYNVDSALPQYLSPLGWEHINLTGDYVWRQARRLEEGQFRPLRSGEKP